MFAADFDYELPEAAVAQAAIEPRDAARLLVTSSLEDRTFRDLPGLLVPEDLLVVNRTRVRPARLRGHKTPSGGAIELLLSKRIDADRWEALIRPARRIRAGQELRFGDIKGHVLTDPDRGVVTVALEAGKTDVDDALGVDGEVPLPPYFRGSLATPDRYQTMFAKAVGSAAAPTAGLHFTPSLAEDLRERGIGIAEVDAKSLHKALVAQHANCRLGRVDVEPSDLGVGCSLFAHRRKCPSSCQATGFEVVGSKCHIGRVYRIERRIEGDHQNARFPRACHDRDKGVWNRRCNQDAFCTIGDTGFNRGDLAFKVGVELTREVRQFNTLLLGGCLGAFPHLNEKGVGLGLSDQARANCVAAC